MSKHHALKTWPPFFEDVVYGRKTFEVRMETDREFNVGDTLSLREWQPDTQTYTGRQYEVEVTYALRGRQWGLAPMAVVMGIKPRRHEPEPQHTHRLCHCGRPLRAGQRCEETFDGHIVRDVPDLMTALEDSLRKALDTDAS